MNTPTDETLFAITGGKGRHAGDHGNHFAQMGYKYDSIDPANGEPVKPNNVATQHRCNLATFLHGNKTPLGIIIASPDDYHMSDLETSVCAWIRHILVEKPMALNPRDLWHMIELKKVAQKKWIKMTTCLPRITDMRYIQLVNMMPGLIKEFWKVTSISHSFTSRNIPKPESSAGRDHFAHEITMLQKILWCPNDTDIQVDIHTMNNAPNFYFCGWKIGEVTFDVSGEKGVEKNEERVGIDFQNGEELHFSTLTGKIQITGDKPKSIPLKEGGSEARLMEITRNFVWVALGDEKDFYLPDSLFLASAKFPATLFPNQEVAS